jgi:hypothetical protein
MAMASTVSLTAGDWITNQSCSRLAAFLMATHRPVEAGAWSLGFDKSDMATLPGGRCAMFRRRRNTCLTITPGSAARIREKLASALAQPEKRQDKEDDHD